MQQTVYFHDFVDGFPETYKGNFSYEGKKALFDYLESFEEEGVQIEFDPIALCCEYTEYKNLKQLQANYPDITSMEDLRDHTTVIPLGNSEGFIIQDY